MGFSGLSGRFGVSDKVFLFVDYLVELGREGFVLELQVRPFFEGLKAEEGAVVRLYGCGEFLDFLFFDVLQ